MLPELTEATREAARTSPHWVIYVAFLVLSALGALLGFQYVGPGDRLAKIEAVNAAQDSILRHENDKIDAVLSLLCIKTTDVEHRLARVSCPTGIAK